MSAPPTSPLGRTSRFERAIVFRLARGAFFVLAVLSFVGLIAGAGAIVGGLVRPSVSKPVAPPPPPSQPEVSLQAVLQLVSARERPPPANPPPTTRQPWVDEQRGTSTPSPAPAPVDELTLLINRLKFLFPGPEYAWDDVTKEKCVRPSAYGCLQQDTETIKVGVSRSFRNVLRRTHDEAERVALVRLMLDIVGKAPAAGREKLMDPVFELARERMEREATARRDYEMELARQKAAYENAQLEQERSKQKFREFGLATLGAAFGLLVLVSIFLAHFAIERHLRALEALLSRQHGVTSGEAGQAP